MERVELTRDVDAIRIPGGEAAVLETGTDAYITQSLGGTYTLQVPSYGGLFRIAGKDAEAIGKEVTDSSTAPAEGAGSLEQQAWEQLKTCYDPEIPLDIVELGLIYELNVTQEPAGASRVDVKMTLTAKGCGMGTSIAADARQKLLMLSGVSEADVQIVWEPEWTPQRISAAGRERLGME